MDKGIENIPILIKELYTLVSKLESYFPDRKFTPDGHLVGSIGEVLVAYQYDLELLPASFEKHDAKTKDGKLVQIKATQGSSIGIRSEPDYLIVVKILPDGRIEEYYNGTGKLAWEHSGKMQKNGQRNITINKLRCLSQSIKIQKKIPKVTSKNYNLFCNISKEKTKAKNQKSDSDT